MLSSDILIIGAGACGLMAGWDLARKGKKVIILEARSRTGGRINTLYTSNFSSPVEMGAEFIHGSLPVTEELFHLAGISAMPMAGKTYQVSQGNLQAPDAFIPDFDILLQKLHGLTTDIPFAEFLQEHLAGDQFSLLREAVTRFAEGYDAADITKVSTFALREEWETDGAANSQFPSGGYSRLTQFLTDQNEAAGTELYLNTVVKEINWQPGQVTVADTSGQSFKARQVIVTVPLGVLLLPPGKTGYIRFMPALTNQQKALQELGFGAVIKILLEFDTDFWNTSQWPHQRVLPDLGFLFTDDAPINAWWTRLPDKTPLLTGWLAGVAAEKYSSFTNEELVELALTSLARIMKVPTTWLQNRLLNQQVVNWVTDPFARGAYAYATVGAPAARKMVSEPVQNTVFFAGEAFFEGPAMGTVEAALASGRQVAQKLLDKAH